MQLSQIPAKIQEAFAVNGQRNNIPVPSQVNVTPGAASYNDGFPTATMQPISSGGVPPSGKDMNGILYAITAIQQWQCAGGGFEFDATFAVANGGYPKGAILLASDASCLWFNLVDGNTTNPEATDGSAANWTAVDAYGIGSVVGLTNANFTLTPLIWAKPIITLAGALTANVQIVFPAVLKQWFVINNTTGNYSVTVKTAGGSGVVIPQGQGQSVYGDGTNIVAMHAPAVGNPNQTFKVAKATDPSHAPNLSQVQAGQFAWGTDTGTANAYQVTLTPTPSAYAGLTFMFKAANTNTGASTLLLVNNGSVANLLHTDGSALAAGEIKSGNLYEVVFDGNYFILIGFTNILNAPTLTSNGTTAPLQASVPIALLNGGAAQALKTGGLLVSDSYSDVAPATGARIKGRAIFGTITDDTTTQAQVGGNISASSLASAAAHLTRYDQVMGLGQSWQNMTASRALATTYTNTGNKAIEVFVTGSGTVTNSGSGLTATVNGLTIGTVGGYGSGGALGGSFIVPPGGTYSVSASSASLTTWYELR